MGEYLVYILKSSICLSACYLFYRLLISRETFYRMNRYFLLFILFLSLLLPLIVIDSPRLLAVQQPFIQAENYILTEVLPVQAANSRVWEWTDFLLGIYFIGCLVCLVRLFICLVSLFLFFGRLTTHRLPAYLPTENSVRLYIYEGNTAPFSWMKWIVISRSDFEKNGREILLHEWGHVRNLHSLDLLIVDLLIVLQWFNPVLWLLRKELQEVHEYEADETVLFHGIEARQYQLLLIEKAVGSRLYPIANSFNHHNNLQKRITMMLKKRSSKWAMAKYAFVLPVAAVAVTSFARPEVKETERLISDVKVTNFLSKVEQPILKEVSTSLSTVPKVQQQVKKSSAKKKEVALVADEMPAFPGGFKACVDYLDTHLKYPKEAENKNIQGRVIVQFTVGDDGKLSDVNVIRSIHPLLDDEAVRVIKSMPNWIPGKDKGKLVAVKFVLPITFKLTKKVEPAKIIQVKQE